MSSDETATILKDWSDAYKAYEELQERQRRLLSAVNRVSQILQQWPHTARAGESIAGMSNPQTVDPTTVPTVSADEALTLARELREASRRFSDLD